MNERAPMRGLPIALDDVSLTMGAVTALDRVTLSIAAGAPSVLIGPNGSGKTTLLRVAMGLVSPSRGVVTWAGQQAAPPTRRAIVFQHPTMLRRSAAENIRYALRAARIRRSEHESRIESLLKLVGLEGRRDRPARRLSGGERQRLALARALACDPIVLFLDEPTASLDPTATKMVEDVVRAVGERGVKVVMSTHDLGEARRLAGEIILLNRGRVVETGPAPSFFDSPKTPEARKFIAGELLI